VVIIILTIPAGLTILQTFSRDVTLKRVYTYLMLSTHEVGCPFDTYYERYGARLILTLKELVIMIKLVMPVQLNSFTHLRVLLVLTDRGILAQSN
jgi:hypothetical protein